MNLRYMNAKAGRTAVIMIMVAQFVLANYSLAYASTQRIFRTGTAPSGGPVSIPVGQTTQLGVVDVRIFRKIRVCVYEQPGSVSPIRVRFLLLEENVVVGELEPLIVSPGSAPTRVFDAPGVELKILVESKAAPKGSTAKFNGVDLSIYGSD